MLAFWLIDHRQAMPNSGIIMAISIGIFFVFSTAAFLLYPRWRDGRRGMSVNTAPSTAFSQQDLEGTVYGMIPGSKYRIAS